MRIYDQEQQAAMRTALEEFAGLEGKPSVAIHRLPLHRRGDETWAILGRTAYRLYTSDYSEDGQVKCEFAPVIVDGMVLGMWPERGPGGILHLQRAHYRQSGQAIENPQWISNYLECAWLRTAELELSDEQIRTNITAEVAQGQTPLTGGRHDY